MTNEQVHNTNRLSPLLRRNGRRGSTPDALNELADEALVRVFELSREITKARSQRSAKHLAGFLHRRDTQGHRFQIRPTVDDQRLGFEVEFQVALAAPEVQLHGPTICGIGQSHATGRVFSYQVQSIIDRKSVV